MASQSEPEFRVTIDGILFNPPWNIPQSIVTEEMLPKISHNPNYLKQHNLVMKPDGGCSSWPGLAQRRQIKFEMENRFDVYLHDTPSKNLFSRDKPPHQPWLHPGPKPRELRRY